MISDKPACTFPIPSDIIFESNLDLTILRFVLINVNYVELI